MKRPGAIWLAFASCLAVVLAAMAWISVTALRSERAERQANLQAAVEEEIRLALWRMDSALVPLIVQESARPYFVYEPFHRLDNAYTRLFGELGSDQVLVPSALLNFESQDILLHFQLNEDDELTSPQAPTGNYLDVATDGYVTGEKVDAAAARLRQLRKRIDRDRLIAMLPEPPAATATRPVARIARAPKRSAQVQQQAALDELSKFRARRGQGQLTREEATDYLNSANMLARYAASDQAQLPQNVAFNAAVAPAAVGEGELRPCWLGEALVLARRVRIDDKQIVQGCWLNWPHIRAGLLASTADLLPNAGLVAAGGDAPGEPARYVLAALPVRLVPGSVPRDISTVASPVQLSLLIAWSCVLVGAAAVAVLLGKAVSLSNRRGAFVSAVTHELRTPLTTFRLYAEMLAGNVITDEGKRAGYLRRLRDEADRLSHLVENVLAYARLAGRRPAAGLESVSLAGLIDRSRERLAALAERADMRLVVEADDDALAAPVRCNASAVEQVLLNLVDNACKYAGRCDDRRVHLHARLRDGCGCLEVRDHGPGIAAADRGRLFRPFRKSAEAAARSAPGIGLGLSLSRRLARGMGGDLRCQAAADGGACFALTLPRG